MGQMVPVVSPEHTGVSWEWRRVAEETRGRGEERSGEERTGEEQSSLSTQVKGKVG